MIYSGPARITLSTLVACLLCSLIAIGIPVLLLELWRARRTEIVISKTEIRLTFGLLVRRVEVIDLARVRDVAFTSAMGWETIIVHSSDSRTPRVELCFAGAGRVFDPLRVAVAVARKTALAVQSV